MRPLIVHLLSFPATFRPDENRCPVVSFPDFPRARTDGKNMQEAFEEATDCPGSVIAAHIAEKREGGSRLSRSQGKSGRSDPQ